MRISFTPALTEYIRNRKKEAIVLEVAQCDNSDIEVTELHPHFLSAKQAIFFM